jgi:hypothetical protein
MSTNQDLIAEAEGDMTLISKEGTQRRVVVQPSAPAGLWTVRMPLRSTFQSRTSCVVSTKFGCRGRMMNTRNSLLCSCQSAVTAQGIVQGVQKPNNVQSERKVAE